MGLDTKNVKKREDKTKELEKMEIIHKKVNCVQSRLRIIRARGYLDSFVVHCVRQTNWMRQPYN